MAPAILKRGERASRRDLSNEQIPMLICRDRTGGAADFVSEKTNKINIGAAAREIVIVHRSTKLAAGIFLLVAKVYTFRTSTMPTIVGSKNGCADFSRHCYVLLSKLSWLEVDNRSSS